MFPVKLSNVVKASVASVTALSVVCFFSVSSEVLLRVQDLDSKEEVESTEKDEL